MVPRRITLKLALVAVLLALVAAACSSGGGSGNGDDNPDDTPVPQYVNGTVFLDQNGNGARDTGESGVSGVVVSNGVTTTTTGTTGGYTLPKEGSFVFVTAPGTHAASGPWYRAMAGSLFDFGLEAAAGRHTDNFTFIHMTDVHLDDSTLVSLNQAVAEFAKISPDFVVCTGDLVNTGDEKTISEAQAAQWFGAYRTAMAGLSASVYNAPGNHDAANLDCELAAGAEVGCSKTAYRTNFGPTYYSFDWGSYHCVVLDPNEVKSGAEVYEIRTTQLGWLQSDLNRRAKGSPLLVFSHEPTTSWQSQDAVLNLLKPYKARIFSGQSHANLLMDSQGVPEQVTAALSGEWGYGNNPDGSQPGYRIVSVAGETLDTFYKHVGASRQVEITPAGQYWPIVSGQVDVVAKVYCDNNTVAQVTYAVDNGTPVNMTLASGAKWSTATASWDTGALTQDYHSLTVTADNSTGFQAEHTVKVSTDTVLTIQDLQAHLRVYQGHYVTIQGVADQAMFNSPMVPAGSGGARFNDGTGSALIYAGECYSPALPTVAVGNTIRARVIPMRFTWAFIDSALDREGTFDMMKMQEGMVPDAQKENAGDTKVARWFMRVVTAGGVTVL